MMTVALWWWAIGFAACMLGFFVMYWAIADDHFWSHLLSADMAIALSASVILGFGGPIIAVLVVYWIFDGWRSRFAVDEDGNILYPWRE